ncbi:MAG: glutamate-5-semialdehyde dehydrogenase [Ruminococcus sp.]|jgi:glutamate-5-semialdehyde dehydrogenase|nr:glutamate-5-semialdehyde dehydrogenase [Ruminococcus sp.]
MAYIDELGTNAKSAEQSFRTVLSADKDKILAAIADAFRDENNINSVISANSEDLKNAVANGIPTVMHDRLMLDKNRILKIADSVNELIALPDPIGEVLGGFVRPNGLRVSKVRVPLGVIGIIFESRPNVTVDAAVLCLKSGNVCILRGGKEAINSNIAIMDIMQTAIENLGFDKNIVQLVKDTSRETSSEMMKANKYIDVLIPRGGAGLIQNVVQNSTVPVIETGAGNCQAYVDEFADIDMAVNIIDNAKTQRPSVCNAIETLLVHKNIADKFLPAISEKWNGKVEMRGFNSDVTEDDFYKEFNDYIIAVKIVQSVDEAISHINKYGTKHSECIVTNSYQNAKKFEQGVDAAAVYVNASTRFTDGGEFGFGAEIGISTQKLHARGPMGLTELTTVKYIINGNGQIR